MAIGKSVQINGEALKALRDEKGWPRDRLAEKADINSKTIQRAENSERIKLELVNQIAQALGCNPSDFFADASSSEQIQQDIPDHHEQLRLKRPDSAKELFKAVKTDILEFDFDVDFDESLSESIAALIRPIEDLKEAKVSGNLKTSDEVLAIGKLSSSIKLLEDSGVCVFIGFTTFRIFNTDVLPTEYDWEIFTHYVTEKTKAVLIFGNCQVKARLETINVGLTWQEARDLLLDRLEGTRSSNNIYVRGNDYGIKEDSLYKMRDNINTPLSTEEDGFDEIPF